MDICDVVVHTMRILRKNGWQEMAPGKNCWHFRRGRQHFYIWWVAGMYDRFTVHNPEETVS